MGRLSTPLDFQVRKVQTDTGMDYLQAYRHIQCRELAARYAAERRRVALRQCLDAWADKTPAVAAAQ